MKKSELIKDPPVKTKKRKGTIYTGRQFRACGETVIETDIYVDGHLEVRHFTYDTGWQTYRVDEGIWDRSSIEWIAFGGHPFYFGASNMYCEIEDEPYKKLCTENYHRTYDMVCSREYSIRSHKTRTAKERKQERLDEKLGRLTPELPEDFMEFIDKKVIGERNAFENDGTVYCGICGHSLVKNKGKKTGDVISCRHCKNKIVFTKRKKTVSWTKGVQLYQETEGIYVERQFDVEYSAAYGIKENIRVTEVARGFAEDPGGMWDKWYYGEHRGCIGSRQQFWDRKNESCVHQLRRKFTLYDRNLEELGLENRIITTVNALEAYGEELEWSYILRAAYNHTFEAVVKSGIKGLAMQKAKGQDPQLPIEGTFTKLHEILCISRQQLRTIREINGTYISVMALQDFKDVPKEELKILEKHGKSYYAKDALYSLKKKGIPLTHVITLLEKTTKATYQNLQYYIDYLSMAEARGMDIHDEIIYRNRRWKEYHDRYVEEDRIRKEAEEAKRRKKELHQKNHKFIGIKKDYKKNTEIFGFMYGDYEFIVPKEASEIVDEGQMQHNCVGASDRYILRMATRESFIVFLRKKEQPKQSFYTIEVDDKKILQAYSAYNRKEEWDKVEPVIKRWHAEVKKRMKKIGA